MSRRRGDQGPNLFGEVPRAKPKEKRGRARVDFPISIPYEARPCSSCGEPIAFVRLVASPKPMPLHVASAQRRGGQLFMESHYAHCPQAETWRKREGSRSCAGPGCSARVEGDCPFCGECWGRLGVELRNTMSDRWQRDRDAGLADPSEAYLQTIEVGRAVLRRARG